MDGNCEAERLRSPYGMIRRKIDGCLMPADFLYSCFFLGCFF